MSRWDLTPPHENSTLLHSRVELPLILISSILNQALPLEHQRSAFSPISVSGNASLSASI